MNQNTNHEKKFAMCGEKPIVWPQKVHLPSFRASMKLSIHPKLPSFS